MKKIPEIRRRFLRTAGFGFLFVTWTIFPTASETINLFGKAMGKARVHSINQAKLRLEDVEHLENAPGIKRYRWTPIATITTSVDEIVLNLFPDETIIAKRTHAYVSRLGTVHWFGSFGDGETQLVLFKLGKIRRGA